MSICGQVQITPGDRWGMGNVPKIYSKLSVSVDVSGMAPSPRIHI